MVTVPSLYMESFGGFLGSSMSTPFFLCGFVQCFSKRPSLSHRWRERDKDSARTPLSHEHVRARDGRLRRNMPLEQTLTSRRRTGSLG